MGLKEARYRVMAWSPYVPPWVDPSKDAGALETLLRLGQTSESLAAAARGEDYEEILEARQRDRELRQRYGEPLEAPAAPAGTPKVPRKPSGEDPDDREDDEDREAEDDEAPRPNRNGRRGASRIAVRS